MLISLPVPERDVTNSQTGSVSDTADSRVYVRPVMLVTRMITPDPSWSNPVMLGITSTRSRALLLKMLPAALLTRTS